MTDDLAKDYPLGPALDFLKRLWALNHALEQLSSRMDVRLGVTAQQRLLLRCIGKYPGISAGHLASLLRLDPGTVSASLNRLQAKALIARRRDPRDRRRSSLGLTPKGRALDHAAPGTVEGAVERLLGNALPEDIAATTLVLEQLTRLVAQEDDEV